MNDDLKARFASFSAAMQARKGIVAVDKTALEKFKARVAAKKAEAQRLKPKHHIPLAEREGDDYLDEARLASLRDDALNWLTESQIVVGQHQLCTCCGHQASATSGFYLRQRHATNTFARRLKRIPGFVDGLPVETVTEGVLLARCINCLGNETRADDLLAATCYGMGLTVENQLKLELN